MTLTSVARERCQVRSGGIPCCYDLDQTRTKLNHDCAQIHDIRYQYSHDTSMPSGNPMGLMMINLVLIPI